MRKQRSSQSIMFANKKVNAMMQSTTSNSGQSEYVGVTSRSFQTRSSTLYQNAENDMQNLSQLAHSATQPPIPAVPASTAYRGDYGFEVSFQHQSKDTKSATWTYSEALRKLYVRMAHTCPVRFKTASSPPPGSIVRAMPVYIKPEHVQEVVRRCPNHASKPPYTGDGHQAAAAAPPQHLLVCEHKRARYDDDPYTGRLSVVIPHEPPQAGTEWVTNLFQFMCFSSCVGGLTRRPIQVIFTLEHSGIVLGRQAVEIRICACPGRDRKNEERTQVQARLKRSGAGSRGRGRKMSRKRRAPTTVNNDDEDDDDDYDDFEDRNNDPDYVGAGSSSNKRQRVAENVGDVYSLTIHGKQNYEILRLLRDSLELAALVPASERARLQRQQSHVQTATPAPVVPTTPASLGRYCLVDVDNFPSPFSGELFGGNFVGLDPLSTPAPPSATASLTPYQLSADPASQRDSRLLTLAAAGLSPRASTTTAAAQMTAASNRDNEVSSSCISGVANDDHQQHDQPDIASWLSGLGFGVYVDDFHQRGLTHMSHLQHYTVDDLQSMKIGSQHVYKIWRSLVEYRNCVVEVPAATGGYLYGVVPAGGDGIVSPGGCDAVLAATAAGDTRLYDVRPPARARVLLRDDHNYC